MRVLQLKKKSKKMKYFTISELCDSEKAKTFKIDNTPNKRAIDCMVALIENCLDKARAAFGGPVIVSSGYRCAALNKKVKGASTSQHLKGQAADLCCKDNAALFVILKIQKNFDQLIWEYGNKSQPAWVHVSYVSKEANRCQVLRAVKLDGVTHYIPYEE